MKGWYDRAGAVFRNSFGARVGLVLLSLASYILIFLLLNARMPQGLLALSLLPVILLGALFGQRAGLWGAIAVSLLNLFLLELLNRASAFTILIENGGWAGMLSMLLVGTLVGYHRDSNARIHAELRDRQRMNDTLNAVQDNLRNLISSNADGMLVVDPAGMILLMNPAAEQLWRAQSGEMLCAQALPLLKTSEPAELSLVGQDGSARVVEMRVAPTVWEGQPAFLAALRDITQRKQTEDNLRLSEERFRHFAHQLRLMQLALDHVSSGVIITDPHQPDNPIIYANPGFERVTGYTPAEVLGRNCRFMQRADREQPALDEIRAALREQRPCQALLRNYRKDGTWFWNELSIRPILDGEGKVVYYVGVQHDVTSNLENQARLEYLSSHDSLTGLHNRNYFHERIEAIAGGGQLPAAVMVADMDGLKQINDRWGHSAGDNLLQQAGRMLTHAFREQDVVARLGGDEFAVLMPNTNLYQSHHLLDAFRAYIDQHNLEVSEHPISFSCGLALLSDAQDVDRVLHHADMAMYAEKARKKKDHL